MAVVFLASPDSLPHGFTHSQARYDSIISAISAVDSQEDVLLVVRDTASEHLARGARLALNDRRTAIHVTQAPATQFFMQAAVLDLLPADHLGLAPLVEKQVAANSYCQVLLSSVSKLAHPNPKLVDHALSALPWSRFLVDWTNQQISRDKQLRDVQAPLLIAAKSVSQWNEEKIDPLPPEVVWLPTQPRPVWQAKRWIELSAFFSYPESLAQGIVVSHGHEGAPRCISCSRLGSGERCLFCGVPIAGKTRDLSSQPQPELSGGTL